MSSEWPDELVKPNRGDVERLLQNFWRVLDRLPDLLARDEMLLCAEVAVALRTDVLAMMLALNGVAYPAGTRHLNTYLSESQRNALNRTMLLPAVSRDGWIAQCVALVVIYRWYAPQLVEAYGVDYPTDDERYTWQLLVENLPEWPKTVTTDAVQA